MLTYKRIYDDNGIQRYEYYPDGNTDRPGVVEFETGKPPKIIQESERDYKQYFAIHALSHIDTSKETGMVAWY